MARKKNARDGTLKAEDGNTETSFPCHALQKALKITYTFLMFFIEFKVAFNLLFFFISSDASIQVFSRSHCLVSDSDFLET